jgi:AraC-like DNA-binding protein
LEYISYPKGQNWMKSQHEWFDSVIEKRFRDVTETNPFHLNHWWFPHRIERMYDMHYGLEFGVALKGCCRRFYQDDWSAHYSPGQIWFSGVWEPHGYEILQPPWECITLHILPECISNIYFREEPQLNLITPFFADPPQRPRVPPHRRKLFLDLGKKLYRVSQHRDSYQQVWLKHILTEILLHVYSFWKPMQTEKKTAAGRYARIQNAIQLVFESHSIIHELQAAQACRMSLSGFNRQFRELTGLSFYNFSLRYHLNGVAMDLLSTAHPVKEISDHWGFRHLGSMDRAFKKIYSCSPAEYREQLQVTKYSRPDENRSNHRLCPKGFIKM